MERTNNCFFDNRNPKKWLKPRISVLFICVVGGVLNPQKLIKNTLKCVLKIINQFSKVSLAAENVYFVFCVAFFGKLWQTKTLPSSRVTIFWKTFRWLNQQSRLNWPLVLSKREFGRTIKKRLHFRVFRPVMWSS